MGEMLAVLGTRLTERVAARLTLPGLLYIALSCWAVSSGHAHPFEPTRVAAVIDRWAASAQAVPLALAVDIGLALLAATAIGIAASTVATEVVGRVWSGRRAPKRWLARRGEAWRARHEDVPERYAPQRLTPIGDRFRTAGEKVDAQYGLSLPDVWPRLLILAGPDTRELLARASDRYRADTVLTAWALLVLPLTVWWWPAALLAGLGLTVGYRRSLASASVLATLIESTVDLHQRDLAASLGVELDDGRVTRAEGPQINVLITKHT
ncbi:MULTISPECIES: hypothetical protein [Glycomyces]|uniref:Uncharacterized protein n=2 Tax=Glycomyces TaxID=58113 RepID=A0A9X3PIK3_9ACTN|nr:hypothetical protein [Glycomyces lechevalierae]MDA1384679.1 hypothetical protein [Glycomyces lechevalierae]MDR7337868.1 hypothetical protein [Glycomyces lechevalierae]